MLDCETFVADADRQIIMPEPSPIPRGVPDKPQGMGHQVLKFYISIRDPYYLQDFTATYF